MQERWNQITVHAIRKSITSGKKRPGAVLIKTEVPLTTFDFEYSCQALRQARAPVVVLEPAAEESLQVSGRVR
ncbi:hypothetical protein PoB_006983700 [Plakobranchus ocellatus]|uniref:Uncharacterized protein n=1 Tax=Plakobranchus ocellatus TaxID=259542 RepID=A0AAV4DGE0_9GAST|nr:hypothetical protein PoB_006983700 [Plakobranchus ocellatus]